MSSSVVARFVSARALNSFGRAVISTTVGYELWERTHDGLVIAAVGAVQVLAVVLLFIPAGDLVDRSDRRRVATFAATVTGLIGIGLALVSAANLPVWTFLALLFAQGCMTALHAPSASSLFPMILERGELERGNRILATFSELANIGGPTLAGLALAFLAPHGVYALIALTGIASGVLYQTLPAPRAVVPTPGAIAGRRDWRVGLRFIFRSKLLLPALALDMFAVLFAGVTALMPAISTELLGAGPIGYGLLRASQSTGAVMMAIIGGRIRPWQRPGRVLLIVVALFGVATIGVGLSRSLPLTAGLLVICGALDNISVVIRMTLEQLVVPDAIRGRVGAVHFVFIGMSNELGGAESGVAQSLLGTSPAIVVGGAVATVVVGVVAMTWPSLARMPPLAALKPEEPPAATAPLQ